MSVTRTVARNTIFQTVGRVLYLVISILMLKLLTGYLGQEGFGQYGVLVDYLGFFGILVDLGLYLIVVQRITEIDDPKERERAVGNIVGLRLLMGLGVFVFAVGILPLIPFFEPELKWAIAIGALSFWAFSMAQLMAGIFQGVLRAEFAALGEVVGRSITLAAVYVCYLNNWGLSAVAVALIVGNLANFLLSYVIAKRLQPFRMHFDFSEYRGLMKEALPIGALMALSFLYIRQDTFVLKSFEQLPGGLTANEAVGFYKAPYKLLETLQGFPGLFMTALFPFLSRYIATNDPRLPAMCQKAWDFLTSLAVPLIVGIVLLAPALIGLITDGEGWDPSILTLRILIFAVSFSFINNFAGHLIIAQKSQARLILPNVFFMLLNLGLNFLLIPYWSFNGAAFATVVTEGVVLGVNIVIIGRVMNWRPKFGALLKILLAAGLMGALVYGLDQLGVYFLLNGAVSGVFYLWLLGRIGGLPDGMTLSDIWQRLRHRGQAVEPLTPSEDAG